MLISRPKAASSLCELQILLVVVHRGLEKTPNVFKQILMILRRDFKKILIWVSSLKVKFYVYSDFNPAGIRIFIKIILAHMYMGFISSSSMFDSSMEILEFTDSLPCKHNTTVGNVLI